jgi:hypothetical protein
MRKDWRFPYTTTRVLEGAKTKALFHAERLAFWQRKQTETMERIKSDGLQVQTSLAGSNYSNVNRGFGAQVVVDATLQRDLDECETKIHEHKAKADTYRGWVEVLAAQRGDVTVELDHEDYLFFFGR